MTIELILAEDIPEIAKSGDTVILKDDNTFEIKNCNKPKKKIEKEDEIEKIKDVRSTEEKPTKAWFDECAKKVKAGNPDYTEEQVNATCGSMHYHSEGMGAKKEYDPRIEKYLSIDKEKSWALLTKFYNAGHLDSYKVLKDFINKIAICPNVTDKFEKIMDDWMRDGEADTSAVEKIIDSCKKEGGNIVREGDDKKTKIESIVKTILNK